MTPFVADTAPAGDGYETLVFDQGKGSDNPTALGADLTDNNKTVQIALSSPCLEIQNRMQWVLGRIRPQPAMFDYNDHMITYRR